MAKHLITVGLTGSSGRIGARVLAQETPFIKFLRFPSFAKASLPEIANYISEAKREGIDSVLHLAWSASSTPGYLSSTDNFGALTKTIFLLDECQRLGLTVYAVGSGADDRLSDGNWYVTSKYILKAFVSERIRQGSVIWLRPFNVFDGLTWPGYLQKIPNEVLDIQDNRKRDFIHIDDVAEAIVLSIVSSLKGSIDIGTGELREPSLLVKAYGGKFRLSVGSMDQVSDDLPRALLRQDLLEIWRPKETDRLFR